uniref:Protein E5 n=1 Tax=Angiostrongylus costaricensis TaxID=334426 RepID=A0A0R3P9F5_ANGCS
LSNCKTGECLFVNICNGVANKFTCFLFDFRSITWLMFGCFLLVLCICSSLVACYACRAIRESLKWQVVHTPNRDVVFNHSGPIHYIHTPTTRHPYGTRR